MDGCLIDTLAQLAVLQAGENGLLGGVDDNDAIRRLRTLVLGVFLALCDVGIAQSCQLFLAVHPHHRVVGGAGQQVAPLLLQVGDAHVDFFHACHLFVGQERT